ncbi:protein of unknown function [Candidatus Filomicrobium marinum]|uniref:Uncharacterized protein n=1 Tax=Candidatus Filomicrobium marinum TaxID=1608628 RepID=A0A0D6JDB9_9HYPH|nr:protein of unknown function [Candidatus Filomicrobium marinum]CPR17852.1 protein of unknown function [Candidatus Filomicrobium marinum]
METFGSGPLIGLPQNIQKTRQRLAVFLKIRAALHAIKASIRASHTSTFLGKFSKEARIFVRQIIVAATGLRHAIRSPSTRRRVTSDFAA